MQVTVRHSSQSVGGPRQGVKAAGVRGRTEMRSVLLHHAGERAMYDEYHLPGAWTHRIAAFQWSSPLPSAMSLSMELNRCCCADASRCGQDPYLLTGWRLRNTPGSGLNTFSDSPGCRMTSRPFGPFAF